jgi:hypothetical protein
VVSFLQASQPKCCMHPSPSMAEVVPIIRPSPRPFATFRNVSFYGRKLLAPPNPQAEGPPLVGCQRLLIQYIRSYTPYLEAFSSIHNLRTRSAVVTRGPLNMGLSASFLYMEERRNVSFIFLDAQDVSV